MQSEGPKRPFGLEDCPVFYPTVDEFKDPMAYVRSISTTAQNYGICKIVPPVGWKMPFVTDTEVRQIPYFDRVGSFNCPSGQQNFRFKTRLQRLNSIEASSRAKLNFLEALYRFHQQQGNPRVSLPTINHKPLDLWLLRKEVHKMGGYDAVSGIAYHNDVAIASSAFILGDERQEMVRPWENIRIWWSSWPLDTA